MNHLAALFVAKARYPEAEPLMRRALAIAGANYWPDHPNVATTLNNLAQLLNDTNRLAEAEPLIRRALAIAGASYGPDHPDVASRLNNLASLLQDTDRLAEAEPLMRRALAIDEASYGPDHHHVAIRLTPTTRPIAPGHGPPRGDRAFDPPRASDRRGELWAGSSQCRDPPQQPRLIALRDEPPRGGRGFDAPCARDRRGELWPDHPDVAISLNNLALLLKDTNRLAEAEPLMRRASS